MTDSSEWVSLGEAAEILGVHPSTVRHWADDGDLFFQRTPGGHRRFRRSDLVGWQKKEAPTSGNVTSAEAQLILHNALGRARMQTSDGQLAGEAWNDRLDENAKKVHRRLGRQLLETLTQYMTEPETEELVRADVRELGAEYGRVSLEHHIQLVEVVRAFLFFRDLLLDSAIQLAETLGNRSPSDWSQRIRQVNDITDELLLVLIETYTSDS